MLASVASATIIVSLAAAQPAQTTLTVAWSIDAPKITNTWQRQKLENWKAQQNKALAEKLDTHDSYRFWRFAADGAGPQFAVLVESSDPALGVAATVEVQLVGGRKIPLWDWPDLIKAGEIKPDEDSTDEKLAKIVGKLTRRMLKELPMATQEKLKSVRIADNFLCHLQQPYSVLPLPYARFSAYRYSDFRVEAQTLMPAAKVSPAPIITGVDEYVEQPGKGFLRVKHPVAWKNEYIVLGVYLERVDDTAAMSNATFNAR
jgi:hypothetical protein